MQRGFGLTGVQQLVMAQCTDVEIIASLRASSTLVVNVQHGFHVIYCTVPGSVGCHQYYI
jgi:hypothetical protein